MALPTPAAPHGIKPTPKGRLRLPAEPHGFSRGSSQIGVILSKENEQDEEKTLFVASFEDNPVRMTRSNIKNIELAYACTVHKSQGSEYPVVVIPVHESQYVMLKRNLLYTGITRAKRQCILVGTRKAAAIAAQNEETRRRSTRLKEKLLSLNNN